MDSKKKSRHPLSVRLKEDVRDWLDARAEQNDRSLSAEINQLLKQVKDFEGRQAA